MSYIPGVSNKAIVVALLFVVVSHPVVYGITNTIFSPIVGPLASPSGAPTTVGLIIHAVVFVYASKYFA
jgi:hypothetical protein